MLSVCFHGQSHLAISRKQQQPNLAYEIHFLRVVNKT